MIFDIVKLELHNPNLTPEECNARRQAALGQHEHDDEEELVLAIQANTDCQVKYLGYFDDTGYSEVNFGV